MLQTRFNRFFSHTYGFFPNCLTRTLTHFLTIPEHTRGSSYDTIGVSSSSNMCSDQRATYDITNSKLISIKAETNHYIWSGFKTP